jgi:hypothetical protein
MMSFDKSRKKFVSLLRDENFGPVPSHFRLTDLFGLR